MLNLYDEIIVNIDNETGIVISPENPEELSDAMISLLDRERFDKYSKGAKSRSQVFSYHNMAEKYAQLYSDVI